MFLIFILHYFLNKYLSNLMGDCLQLCFINNCIKEIAQIFYDKSQVIGQQYNLMMDNDII